MSKRKGDKDSVDAMVKAYREKWGVSEEEAQRQVKRFLERRPVDRSKAAPSLENLFPEPVGPLSEKIQDINQAALSTVFTRRSMLEMSQPPEEIKSLKEEVDDVKRTVNGMLELINTTVQDMKKTLEAKQAEEERTRLIEELEAKVIKPLKEDLESVKERVREVGKVEGRGAEVKESIVELGRKVKEAEKDAKEVLKALGYPVPEAKVQVKAPLEDKSTEELIETLRSKGYKVEYEMISREQALELAREAQKRAQEEVLDDRRIQAVENIIRDTVKNIFEMFGPPIQKLMEASLVNRGAEPGRGVQESKREEPSASQAS